MIHIFKSKTPLIFSAYAAALFVFFAFVSNSKLDYFVLANLLLFAAWSAYTWLIIWDQDKTIDEMQRAMQIVRDAIKEVIKESDEENKV